MAQSANPLLTPTPTPSPARVAFTPGETGARRHLAASRRRLIVRGALVLVIILVAILAATISPRDPLAIAPAVRLKPPGSAFPTGGIALLGTDGVGRDVLSRVIWGARLSLFISLVSVLVAAAIGITLGLISGFYGKTVDGVIMRVTDMQQAIPSILLAMVLAAVLGLSVPGLILALGVSRWTDFARLIRGQVLDAREQEYVQAARASGASQVRIMVRHILPNIIGSAIIVGTLMVGQLIIAESSLSFLGLGLQPPTPSWGGMISDGRDYLDVAWWASTFPGLAIALTVLAVGSFGDALRDVLDPRFRED
ncbi:MAG: ABC transporter permease [Chloroflexota bacterium]